MTNNNESNVEIPESIELWPWPTMDLISENKWKQELLIDLILEVSSDYKLNQIAEEIVEKVVYHLREGFKESYRWDKVDQEDFTVILELQNQFQLFISIITGKYSNDPPFYTFAPLLTLQEIERKFGKINKFIINGISYNEWQPWDKREMWLGILASK